MSEIKTVGRFINRGADDKDGLLIGTAFRNNPFKPNTVYEIVDILGELIIREVGKSIVADNSETFRDSPMQLTWGSSIEQVLNTAGKYLFLSRDEYAKVWTQEHRAFLVGRYDEETVKTWEGEGKDLADIRD